MKSRCVLLSTVAIGLVLQSLPSAAEELEEIIVTARKKQESILRVPVIENVVTQEVLQQHQISDLTGLSSQVPGLSMGKAVLTIGPQISIRGVGTSTLDAGVDQSVSLNLDGLSMTQGLAFGSGLFDLAQAEVLKGPQALFYGKNSPGGVVALRTADPSSRTEAIVRAGYEKEAVTKNAELILSTPLTDTLGVRLAGKISDSGGFFHNLATAAPGLGGKTPEAERFAPTRSAIGRATVLWKPTDIFDVRLKINVTKDTTDGDAGMGTLTSCPDGKSGGLPGVSFFNPNDDCTLDRNVYLVSVNPASFPGVRNNGTPFFNLQQQFGTVEMNYRPASAVSLTSVTGYYKADVDAMINGVLSGYAGPSLIADNNFHRKDFTQEFRGDTEFGGPFNFTGGVFYQNSTVFNRIIVGGNTALGLPATLTTGSHKMYIHSYSVFGQGRWTPIEKLELAAGVRWAHERRGDSPYSLTTGTPVFVAAKVPEISASNYSPEITVTYTPTDDLTVFGSVKQGYKSGSFTITTPVGPGVDNSFGDEKISGAEVGMKSFLLDRTLSFNAATYYYIYKGMQVGTNEPSQNGLPIIRTINAGEAKIYGVDLDLTWRVPGIDGMKATAAANWNHGRFTDLKNVPCWGGQTIAAGCNAVPNTSGAAGSTDPTSGQPLNTAQGNLDGLRLVRAPDWQVNAGLNYELPISGDVKLNTGVDAQYTSKYLRALNDRPDAVQPGYTTFSANLSMSGDRWEVALIGNNLTNKITSGSCTTLNYARGQILGGEVTGGVSTGAAGIDENTCVARPGRELWLRVTLKAFGS